jgi:hypothetical protein
MRIFKCAFFPQAQQTSYGCKLNSLPFSSTDCPPHPEAAMISKCANPTCSARFLYLHEGKLFRFERDANNDTELLLGFDPTLQHKHSPGVEFFWLCRNCAARMTLIYCKGVGVTAHPLHRLLKAAS